jgi:hypothetical protein
MSLDTENTYTCWYESRGGQQGERTFKYKSKEKDVDQRPPETTFHMYTVINENGEEEILDGRLMSDIKVKSRRRRSKRRRKSKKRKSRKTRKSRKSRKSRK